MKLIRLDPFKDDYKRLPKHLQRRTEKALHFLIENLYHPSLRVKKMGGKEDIWEARVTRDYRITFEINHSAYILRRVGTHGKTLRRP